MLPGAAVSGRTDQRHTNGPHIFAQPRATGRVWGKTVFVEAQIEPRALTKTAYLCPATGNRPCLSSQTQRSSPGLAGPGLDLGVHRDFMLTLRM